MYFVMLLQVNDIYAHIHAFLGNFDNCKLMIYTSEMIEVQGASIIVA